MGESGIKGSAFESVVVDVNRLIEEGTLSRSELELQLTAEDLKVLESKVQAALWYPIDTFGRLTEVLLRKEGRGDFEYLIERGRRAAKRLVESGVYSQLSANQATLGDRVGRVMITLGPGMYRDTEWEYESDIREDGRGFRIRVTIPADFPDLCRYSTLGCVEYLAQRSADNTFRVVSRRESPTLMSFVGRAISR
jgi:hypothetical protein